LNKKGKTLTPLRPSGAAEIEGLRLDVVTDGDYIEAGVKIKVAQVTGNQIIVQSIDKI
jgi:membrane-bound ClpP family serine protease